MTEVARTDGGSRKSEVEGRKPENEVRRVDGNRKPVVGLIQLFMSNGQPEMRSDWYCGRSLGLVPVYSQLENDDPKVVGDEFECHAGFGMFRKYVLVERDGQVIALQKEVE